MSTEEESAPADATEALEQLGRLAPREHSMESLLQTAADLTKKAMPGHPELSVSLLINDQPGTVVYTGRLALHCDERQYERGHGPCLHAARSGELTEIADTRTETRWPDYVQRAAERGARSSLSVPLPINEGVYGALNIYAREPNAFDQDSRSVATKFAPYVAVAAAHLCDEDAGAVDNSLQAALEAGAIIDQAKGVVMERYQLTADQAFQFLAQVAMTTKTRLRDVADRLLHTGQIPLE
ncbi:MAG TPA: GAF and ANTAR domain-containing protein [Geodermatophilus sp.]|nr:GAF and ANTAR domain-containing protein [Geodermatophilus sp.]